MFLLKIVFFTNFLLTVGAYNILGIFPHPGKSHVDVFLPLMKGLAAKGHNVTVISHFPLKKSQLNYTDVDLGDRKLNRLAGVVNVNEISEFRWSKYGIPLLLLDYSKRHCTLGFKSKNLQTFLGSKPHNFDVIIAETFNSDCFLALAQKIPAPIVGFSSCAIMTWHNNRFGNPSNPAYIPNIMLAYSDKMSFLERVENAIVTVMHRFMYDYLFTRSDDKIVKEYFGTKMLPLSRFYWNMSLLLVNSHFSLNLARPMVPNVIEVGGIHVREPKQLRGNIEKWINESSEGVIYFSLGSMIKGHTFPEDKKQAFLKAFGRLSSYRVLWKWENETMASKPDNVMTQKWMPQFDILCHPNVKAFISHGGLLGTTEAVHCGVPTIVMPQFGDQHTNARALEANGGGIILQLHDVTEERVFKALKKVLSSDFRKKAKELSERFRDRPLPPLETAIYWIEYVARHRGAPHMRTAAVGMPFWKYYLIDVISFLLVISLIFVYSSYIVIKFLIGKLLHKDRTVNKEKSS